MEKEILERIEKKLDKVESKVDDTINKMHEVDKTLVKQEENLRQHMYRTELLEKELSHFEGKIDEIEEDVNKTKGFVLGILKLFAFISTIVGIISAILKMLP